MTIAATTFQVTISPETTAFVVGETMTGNGWSADVTTVTGGGVYQMDATTFTGTLATGAVTGDVAGDGTLSTWTVVLTQSNETAVNITGVADLGDYSCRFTTDVAHGYSAGDFALIAGTTDYNFGWLVNNTPSTTEFDVFYPEDTDLTEITGTSDGLEFTSSQTGTVARGDANPTGLAGLPGVTSQVIANRTVYTLDENTTFDITGAFNLDPTDYQINVLRQGNDSFHLNDGTNGFFMLGRRRRAANGVIYYSKGIAISGGWNSSGSSQIDMNAGWFVANGGEVRIGTRFNINGSLNLQRVNKMTHTNTAGGESQYRIGNGSGPKEILGLTLDGQTDANKLFIRTTVDYGVFTFLRASFQTFLNADQDITLENFNIADNIHTEDLLGISSTAANSTTVDAINPNAEPRGAWGGNDFDYFRTSRRVILSPVDSAGTQIPEYSIYATDFDDGNRRVGPRFAVDGTQDDTATTVYSAIDSTAASETFLVKWKVQIFDNGASPTEITSYYYNGSSEIPFKVCGWDYAITTVTPDLIGLGNNRPRTVLLPDFDQSNRSRATVDALATLDTTADVYDSYKSFMLSNFETYNDFLITITNGILQLDDGDMIIDATAVAVRGFTAGTPNTYTIKSSTFTGSVNTTGTVELQNGVELSGGTFTCDVITADDTGTTHTNATITKYIHSGAGSYAVEFDGSSPSEVEVTGGGTLTVTLSNGAPVPTLTETSGTIVLVQSVSVSFPNILDGTRYQLYNVTQDVELSIGVVSGGSGYTDTVDLQSANVTSGDTLAARFAYYDTSGGTVYNDRELEFTITTAGFTSTLAQTTNTIITAIHAQGSAFEGPNVTGFTLDVANVQVDSSVTSIDGQKLATWLAYEIASTNDGIRNYFDAIDSLNTRNFRFKSAIQVDNTGSPAIWTGAAWTRTDGVTIVASSSNIIQFDNGLISVPTVGGERDADITTIVSNTNRVDGLIEDSGGDRFTTKALEQAPSGGGGSADWTTGEKEQIRDALGVTGTKTSATGGQLQDVLTDTGTTLPAQISSLNDISTADVAAELATYDAPTKAELDAGLAALNDFDPTTDQVIVATNNDKSGYTISGTLTTLDALDTAQDAQHTQTQADIAGLNDLSAAEVNAQVDSALLDYDGPTKAELDAAQAAIQSDISGLNDPTAATIADAVLDEALAGHVTAGTLGKAVADIEADTNELQTNQGDWATATGFATPGDQMNLADGAITAAKIAADAITAAKIAAGAITSSEAPALANLDTTVSSRATPAQVAAELSTYDAPTKSELDAAIATLATAASLSSVASDVSSILTDTGTTLPALIAALNDISTADVAAELATYDGPTKAELDAAVATLATAANLATVDTVVDAIKAKTDSLTFTQAGQVDANIQYVNDVEVNGTGANGDEWGPA